MKIGDEEEDKSAIIESNMILGALNGDCGDGRVMGADQPNNTSSFLKNNDSGNGEDQVDGALIDKPADSSSGVNWLSAQSQPPPTMSKDSSEKADSSGINWLSAHP